LESKNEKIESRILFEHILNREAFITDSKSDRDWEIGAEGPRNTKMRVSSGRAGEIYAMFFWKWGTDTNSSGGGGQRQSTTVQSKRGRTKRNENERRRKH